jgi:hypothetical protein
MADDKSNASTASKKRSDDKGKEPETGAGAEATHGTGAAPADPDAAGTVRDREHVSGYGGHGGEPKTSSDEREPRRPD